MSETRRERRRAAIRARKAATKARLAEPVRPPTVPVALPWKRRAKLPSLRRIVRDETEAVWSTVMSGSTTAPLIDSLHVMAAFVQGLRRQLGKPLVRRGP